MRYRPEQHLRRQGDIRAVREKGRRTDCGAFTLWWLERPQDPASPPVQGPRVCVVASIAAVGKAVQRTRAKRRLRELFRLHQSRVPEGLDLMLLAKSACVKVEFKELERRFLTACERLTPRVRPAASGPSVRPPVSLASSSSDTPPAPGSSADPASGPAPAAPSA